jgi:hypothetical protein
MNTYEGEIISIFGLQFVFGKNQTYKLVDTSYDVIDLICITESLFRSMESINRRGYVSLYFLSNSFINGITQHLFRLGYEEKFLGNS